MRWIGIDEAGYGPNLGPLVMTAVVAQSRSSGHDSGRDALIESPDLWTDLAANVDRAGGLPDRLWVDDSKRILAGGTGRQRLETACLALIDSVGCQRPHDDEALLRSIGLVDPTASELTRWNANPQATDHWPSSEVLEAVRVASERGVLSPSSGEWRFVGVRSVLVGPECFNNRLAQLGNKAKVHFAAFLELLGHAWELARDGVTTIVTSDKHGGRHYYLEPLIEAFPDVWIERGAEGPELSRYHFKAPGRDLRVSFRPRADQTSGLVALASIVSKTVREVWMDRFNGFWTSRIEGLRPTAGYPVDAARFRREIEPLALALKLSPNLWWRQK